MPEKREQQNGGPIIPGCPVKRPAPPADLEPREKVIWRDLARCMQLSRPLLPDQRIAFVELLTAKLNGRGEIGDGALYQICRELQRELLIPPLETHHGRALGAGKYSR
jgi:hypothetical protein